MIHKLKEEEHNSWVWERKRFNLFMVWKEDGWLWVRKTVKLIHGFKGRCILIKWRLQIVLNSVKLGIWMERVNVGDLKQLFLVLIWVHALQERKQGRSSKLLSICRKTTIFFLEIDSCTQGGIQWSMHICQWVILDDVAFLLHSIFNGQFCPFF